MVTYLTTVSQKDLSLSFSQKEKSIKNYFDINKNTFIQQAKQHVDTTIYDLVIVS
jgi:hypothetical protein